MSKIRFADGIPHRDTSIKILYPEDLMDKKCGGCTRCQQRRRGIGYHCTMQPYDVTISPEDRACVKWWDAEEQKRIEQQRQQDIENRRKQLWEMYAHKEPVKLPLVFDGFGNIPECPICGEMPYDLDQCHWCGQRFIKDSEIEQYAKGKTKKMQCINCGTEVIANISSYNGHMSYACDKCGCKVME